VAVWRIEGIAANSRAWNDGILSRCHLVQHPNIPKYNIKAFESVRVLHPRLHHLPYLFGDVIVGTIIVG
jgi:hypothetical protein